jgi:ribosomal protein L7/L12
LYATDYQNIVQAQTALNKALALRHDNPEVTADIQKARRELDDSLKRRFTCNWAVAIIIALLGIPAFGIPTILAILYVISTYTPQYRINKQLVAGKHFNQFAALGKLMPKNGGAVANILGFCLVYTLAMMLLPVFVAINFYRNWFDKMRGGNKALAAAISAAIPAVPMVILLVIVSAIPATRAQPGGYSGSHSPSVTPAPAVAAYDVVLESVGPRKDQVVNVLCNQAGVGSRNQAERLISRVPATIGSNMPQEKAESLRNMLTKLGARVTLKPAGS